MLVPVGRRANVIAGDKRVDPGGTNDFLDSIRSGQQLDNRPQQGQAEEVIQSPPSGQLAARRGAAARLDGVEMIRGFVIQVPEFAVSNLRGSM